MSFLKNTLKTAATGLALGIVGNLLSQTRSINLPKGGEIFKPSGQAKATMGNNDPTDWRVRLSIPPMTIFQSSPYTIQPLIDAGGLVFPYTPTITVNHSASYTETPVIHQNYQFITYQHSKVSDIQIIGDFPVQDAKEAQYWLATVHFLRTVTKMFTGDSPDTGNPPPILLFNAYGDFVFKNVSVVVKSFSVTLPKEVDYIRTNLKQLPTAGNPLTGENFVDSVSSSGLGLDSMLKAGVMNAFSQTQAGKIGAKLLGAVDKFNNGIPKSSNLTPTTKSTDRDSHVPTQSTITVTIMPVYSRTKVREFNLQKFINGDYVDQGYI
jgi:hypothetical protein